MSGAILSPEKAVGPRAIAARPATFAAAIAAARYLATWFTYAALGTVFGFILVRSEAVSWFRIQEMFRFQSFHLYKVLGSAVVVAALLIAAMKYFKVYALNGQPIHVPPKEWGRGYRYVIGGTIFGFGWALLGACPGPIFALIGSGATVLIVSVLSALVGTWTYAWLRPRLPH